MALPKFLRSLPVTVSGFVVFTGATAAQIGTAARPVSAPDGLEWFTTPPNPWMLLTALLAGLGAVASLYQLFGPKPVTKLDLREDGRKTRGGIEYVSAQIAAEGRDSKQRDSEIAGAIRADRIGFTPNDIRDDRISEPKAIELGEAIVHYLRKARPELAEDLIQRVGGAATRAAESSDERRREVAALLAEGRYAEAGALQQAIAADLEEASAEAHRDAGRLLSLTNIAAAISEFRRAVELDPMDFVTWIELTKVYLRAGSPAEARRAAEQALQVARTERHRSIAESELGYIAIAVHDLAAAKAHLTTAMLSHRARAEADPGSSELQHDLAITHERLGDLARNSGDREAAQDHYSRRFEIIDKLVRANPRNAAWQRDLAISHDRLGDVAAEVDEGRRHYQASLKIREALVASDPNNLVLLRDLSISRNRLGRAAVEAGDKHEARKQFEADLEIANELARREPKNAEWQRDIFISQANLAQFAAAFGDREAALRHFEEARGTLADLIKMCPDHEGYLKDMANVERDLAHLRRREQPD